MESRIDLEKLFDTRFTVSEKEQVLNWLDWLGIGLGIAGFGITVISLIIKSMKASR